MIEENLSPDRTQEFWPIEWMSPGSMGFPCFSDRSIAFHLNFLNGGAQRALSRCSWFFVMKADEFLCCITLVTAGVSTNSSGFLSGVTSKACSWNASLGVCDWISLPKPVGSLFWPFSRRWEECELQVTPSAWPAGPDDVHGCPKLGVSGAPPHQRLNLEFERKKRKLSLVLCKIC